MRKPTNNHNAPRSPQEPICGSLAPDRLSYVLGFDLGFADSPTAAALLGFDMPQPHLILTNTFRPRCGGGWQHRVDDVLAQIEEWLPGYVLLEYGKSLLIAYSLPHLREQKDGQAKPLRKGKNERANGSRVLNPQTALKLADLGGGIRGLAVGFRLPCIGVQESESKTALTRNPQASKQEMIDMARRVFGQELTEHEADSIGHAMAGESNYRRERLVRKASKP